MWYNLPYFLVHVEPFFLKKKKKKKSHHYHPPAIVMLQIMHQDGYAQRCQGGGLKRRLGVHHFEVVARVFIFLNKIWDYSKYAQISQKPRIPRHYSCPNFGEIGYLSHSCQWSTTHLDKYTKYPFTWSVTPWFQKKPISLKHKESNIFKEKPDLCIILKHLQL